MRLRASSLILLAALTAGCGSGATPDEVGPRSDRLVDFSQNPPYVNSLDVDPATGDFLLTTNRGFWRIDPEGEKVSRVEGEIRHRGKEDTVGTFLELEVQSDGSLIGSGHPDHQDTLPPVLGFISSDDDGRTWKSVARMGNADLHKIVSAHDKLYAWDAVLSAILVYEDGARTFIENSTPPGELVVDFVVDPEDQDYLVAATEEELLRSEDMGAKWRPVTSAQRARLSWPAADALYRADQDGTVHVSDDAGATWSPVSKVDGEPYKFKETEDPNHLYLALSDGTIVETTDGAETWSVAFKP